jgi:periplasmic divalent cation tolerance protein
MKSEVTQEARIVLVTFPNLETARQIGSHLVESQLIACINLIPAVESLYRWEGKVNSDQETIGILKTTKSCLITLEETFLEKHPYEVPEFLVIKPDSGFDGYLKWISESCRKQVKKHK